MLELSLQITKLVPALIFFILNVLIPGPNVLNTIATSMGSGRTTGIVCAFATGLGVFCTAITALFGAAFIFYKFPIIYSSISLLGAIFLLYFAKRYIQKAFFSSSKILAVENIKKAFAFRRAFLVLMSNPKMMTTWLAVISLFPIVASNFYFAVAFSLMAALSSFVGHLIFATVFSTSIVSKIYMSLYRPINALVGFGFIFYAIKLFLNII